MIGPTLISAGILFLVQVVPSGADSGTRSGSQTPSLPRVTLVLRSEARIRGRRILLGDVARIETSDRVLAARLAGMPLGPAPRGRWARWIAPTEVVEAAERAGVTKKQIRLLGAPRVQVSAIQQRIEPDEILRAAEDVLRALLKDEGETDATWEPLARPAPAIVPAGRSSNELVADLPSGRLKPASAFFRVDVKVDGETAASVPVSFRLHRYRDALVLVRPVARGEALSPEVLGIRRIDVAGRPTPPFRSPNDVAGLVAARDLKAGTVLGPGDLMKPAVVRKGDLVTVVAVSGHVKVTTRGFAQRDGAKDDVIPVRIGAKRTPVFGRVFGTGIVVVTPPSETRIERRER